MEVKKPVTVVAQQILDQMKLMAGDSNENLTHLPATLKQRIEDINADLIEVRHSRYSHLPFETLQAIATVKQNITSLYLDWKTQDEKSGNPESNRVVKTAMALDYLQGIASLAVEITDPNLGTKQELREQTAAWPPFQR